MRILVTGGGGFLGQEIVHQLLARGESVRSFGRMPQPELAARGVEVFQGDLADAATVERAMDGCDAVIHTAAKAGVWGSWDAYYRPNVLGTQNVLSAMRRQGVTRLVYTSTPSVVFNDASHAGVDETQPYGKKFPCHYPHTKALAEQMALAAHDPKDLKVIALRPHLIWGAGDPHLVPRILARAHKLRIIGDGHNRVDLTHVCNAAQAHLLALDVLARPGHPASGKVYFISDGAPVLLWEWINDLLKKLGQPPVTRQISLAKAKAAGTAMEIIWRILPFLSGEPPLTRFVATELAKDHWYAITAARNQLGYAPKADLGEEMDELTRNLNRR